MKCIILIAITFLAVAYGAREQDWWLNEVFPNWDDEDFAANILEFLLEKKKSKECSVGRAVVSTSGDGCPSSEAGKSATGKARGTTHADCTKAKHIARANLRAKVPRACHKYITSTPPCKIVKC